MAKYTQSWTMDETPKAWGTVGVPPKPNPTPGPTRTPQPKATPTEGEYAQDPNNYMRMLGAKYNLSPEARARGQQASPRWENTFDIPASGYYDPANDQIALGIGDDNVGLHELAHAVSMPRGIYDAPEFQSFIQDLHNKTVNPDLAKIAVPDFGPDEEDYRWSPTEIYSRLVSAFPGNELLYPPAIAQMMGNVYSMPPQSFLPTPSFTDVRLPWLHHYQPQPMAQPLPTPTPAGTPADTRYQAPPGWEAYVAGQQAEQAAEPAGRFDPWATGENYRDAGANALYGSWGYGAGYHHPR